MCHSHQNWMGTAWIAGWYHRKQLPKVPWTQDECCGYLIWKYNHTRHNGKICSPTSIHRTNTARGWLPNSRKIAHIRFSQLERRLAANDELRQQYMAFMMKYFSLGHIRELTLEEIYSARNYYLPHHAVCKAESTTIKVRMMFNASQIGTISCCSDPYIPHILMKWRKFKHVIAVNIEKMYRQNEKG